MSNTESTLSLEKEPTSDARTFPSLVVDLDGTLVKTDLLVESIFALLKQNPLYVFFLLFWLMKGMACLKRQIGQRVSLDVSLLPYHTELLEYLKAQHAQGRPLVLATASDEHIARQVADFLHIFDIIFASDGIINLSGRRKRDRIVAEFGEKNFDYAGNERRDLAVWSSSRRAILVGPTRRLLSLVAGVAEIERTFAGREEWLKPYVRALRLHHWLKNILVFVPLLLAHRYFELHLLANAFLAFLSFGLCASSGYIVNDMTDLPADRRHPHKRRRPFAAGELPLVLGLASIPLLLCFSILLSFLLPRIFLGMMVIYFLLNMGYSFILKRVVILDVIVLAGLYTVRIMAGSASVNIWPSSWLLAFSIFLFLSLALVKRYAELVAMSGAGETAEVRGYRFMDKELLASLGCGSGYVAVLVLAIYISSGTAEAHYSRHQLIWFLCPLLLYWISYMWLIAHRDEIYNDPVVFIAGDRTSRIVFLLAIITLLLAR